MKAKWQALAIVAAMAGTSNTMAREPMFIGLGDLPGEHIPVASPYSEGLGVSNGGRVVVGQSISFNGYEAFRWTAEDGMQPLGDLPGGGFLSLAVDVSANGSAIAGSGLNPYGQEVFRWSNQQGMQGLGGLIAAGRGNATAISDDGRVIVGLVQVNLEGTFEAAIWRDGQVQSLGDLPGGLIKSSAYGVSGDGRVVVGQATRGADFEAEAFYWTEATGMVGMGYFDDGYGSYAADVSHDGSVIVGVGGSATSGTTAWRWTAETGMQDLGRLHERGYSYAVAVSADGSLVVGSSATGRGFPNPEEAFIWDAAHGMRHFQTVLQQEYGLDLSDWILHSATAISPDGTAITGFGTNPAGDTEGWLAILPEPSCAGLLSVCWLMVRRRR